jgi:hypothetical protein
MVRCKDCKHRGTFLTYICYNKKFASNDSTGDLLYPYTWAARQDKCGHEAVGFEPGVLYKLKKLLK